MKFLSEFNFEIKDIKGKENHVVDALSRKNQINHMKTINTWKSNMRSRLIDALGSDCYYLQIKESLQQGDIPPKYVDYKMNEKGVLMYKKRYMYLRMMN